MVESGGREHIDGPYGRLLQRLALALEEARTASQLGVEEPLELDVRGISAAEVELIRAYQEGDLQWLRGWQAAAAELAFMQRQRERPSRPRLAERVGRLRLARTHQPQFSCALCGEVLAVPFSLAGAVCRQCGSRLFRGEKSR